MAKPSKPSKAALGKRKAPLPAQNAKKSKGTAKKDDEFAASGKPQRKPDQPKKVKRRDQKILPVPKTEFAGDGSDDDFDDDDLGVEEGLDVAGMGSFLKGVDKHALSRTTKETQRLHDLSKSREAFPKQSRRKERMPSIGSASLSDYNMDSDEDFPSEFDTDEEEAEGSGTSSTLEDDEDEDDDEDEEDITGAFDELSEESSDEDVAEKRKKRRVDGEADYETTGRSRWVKPPPQAEETSTEVGRLPIKLPTGEIQTVAGTTKIALPPSKKAPAPVSESEEEEEEEEDEESDDGAQTERMATQKGRFGRLGVAEIVGMAGWKNLQKLEAAKEQIAVIGAEILAGGELIDIGPVLSRLSTFALPTVPSLDDDSVKLPVPNSIRGLAFLSQLAVYKDLVPGYRIRALTALEEAEKVRDDVKRLREGEKLLVRSYKGYLKMLENEVKQRTALMSLSLKCMCDLLVTVTHFNFSENIMGVLVGRIAKKSWDEDSELVLQSFVDVFKADVSGLHSQTLVRLIARMIKERKFQVNPNVLGCLLNLRLRHELDSMRGGKKGKGRDNRNEQEEKKFKSDVRKKWQTKNQKKREKELKEVQKEQAEAEAEVDQEERAQVHTETLKNLFVLYFSVLKHPGRSPLLPTALEGISQFTHFINIDFFRDLLVVLRKIIIDQDESKDEDEDEATSRIDPVGMSVRIRTRLLAIVTAFELLSGQGEAINIDLVDFINALFALLRPLSLDTGIEDPPQISTRTAAMKPAFTTSRGPPKQPVQLQSTGQMMFRCLHIIFFSRHASSATSPPWRAAAFAKRLAECSLFFPPETAKLALQFVRSLMTRYPSVEGLLDTEERTFDGVFKPEMDDPQLVNTLASSLWELEDLGSTHWDFDVRHEAVRLREAKLAA